MAVKKAGSFGSGIRSNPRTPNSKPVLFWTLALAVFVLDQITKAFVRQFLVLGESVRVLPFLHFTHVKNVGITFGLLQFGVMRGVAALLAIIVIFAILLYYYKRVKEKALVVAAALVLAGAAGNLVDRLLFGPVTDFIDFLVWPAFNIADSALVIGVVLVLWASWKESGSFPKLGR